MEQQTPAEAIILNWEDIWLASLQLLDKESIIHKINKHNQQQVETRTQMGTNVTSPKCFLLFK